jgi:crotonobetainyl-CoA hydratase
MTSPVLTRRDGAVFEITLDRPKANAINVPTSNALYAAFAEFRDDPALSVAILCGGEGRFFSAGWDLKAGAEGEAVDADHGPGGFAGLTELWDLDKPVVAAVNGLAFGGGFELALAADLILAADTAEFALTEVTLGIMADAGGVLRLPKRLPLPIAMEMLMTARRMGAEEALRWGLVNKVVPKADLMTEARSLAQTIAANAPLALKAIKAVIKATLPLDVKEGYRMMRSGAIPAYDAMLRSEDALEGPQAFAEKRSPEWKGK